MKMINGKRKFIFSGVVISIAAIIVIFSMAVPESRVRGFRRMVLRRLNRINRTVQSNAEEIGLIQEDIELLQGTVQSNAEEIGSIQEDVELLQESSSSTVSLLDRGAEVINQPSSFPIVIDVPGAYRLGENITCEEGDTDAILIDADNVTLDLGGFSIIGPDSGTGIGITLGSGVSPLENIEIINGNIEKFSQGIYCYMNLLASFKNIVLSNNLKYGIHGGGITKVEDCYFYRNNKDEHSSGCGIVMDSCSMVKNCIFKFNRRCAISVGSGSIVKDNMIFETAPIADGDSAGILVRGGYTVIEHNLCVGLSSRDSPDIYLLERSGYNLCVNNRFQSTIVDLGENNIFSVPEGSGNIDLSP